jgi:hypothetical protein
MSASRLLGQIRLRVADVLFGCAWFRGPDYIILHGVILMSSNQLEADGDDTPNISILSLVRHS